MPCPVLQEVRQKRVFLVQKRSVEIKAGIRVPLVEDNQHGRAAAEALDVAQPVFGPLVAPAIKDKHIQAAAREEKLVRGVHDLLAAEVPEVAAELLARACGLPLLDPDAVRGGLVRVEPRAVQLLDQRSLARRALAHKDDLDLRHFLGLAFRFGEVFADGLDTMISNLYGRGDEGVAGKQKLF